MKAAFILLLAFAAVCLGAALPVDADIVERQQEDLNLGKRQVTIVVTVTTTKTTAKPVYSTSTKYTTLPIPVVTKTSTITKPYSSSKTSSSMVIITVTGKPTTKTPPPVTQAHSTVKPPVTVTITVNPPEETEDPEEPEDPNTWQITRTLPGLTLGRREASPVPDANPQELGSPTRTSNWLPTVVETQTVKETATYYHPSSTCITETVTITPTETTSLSTSTKTVYYTPTVPTSKAVTTWTSVVTVVPTITVAPPTVTWTYTPAYPTKSTATVWGKRSPQTLGFPSRTDLTLPTETEYPDPEDPEDPEEPEYPDPDEPTFVLGTPTRTVYVSPTPIKPTSLSTSTKKPTTTKPTYVLPPPSPTDDFSLGTPTRTVYVSPTPPVSTTTKKPWWYYPPPHPTTKYTPTPQHTGTLIINSGTLPVLTLGGKRAVDERQGADADVSRSPTFAPGAPVRTGSGFVTSTVKP